VCVLIYIHLNEDSITKIDKATTVKFRYYAKRVLSE
jgi:hypothetical protein